MAETALSMEAAIKREWQDLLDKDDRTSPAEYPDMVLITFEEFKQAIERCHAETPATRPEDDAVQCEGCSKAVVSGMKYTSTTDGCTLCEECAPSYQDCVDHWEDAANSAPDLSLTEEELEWKRDSEKALADHVAAGGSPNDKPLWVML